MQLSLAFTLFLVLGVLGQVEWVAIRIRTASTTASSSSITNSSSFTGLPASTSAISSSPPRTTGTSLVRDSCLTYFATTITPATSYFTEYTIYEEPFISTSTNEAVVSTTTTQAATISTTTARLESIMVPSIFTNIRVNTITSTETATETVTKTSTIVFSTTSFTQAARRRDVDADRSSTAPAGAPALCPGVQAITVTASAPSSTITATVTSRGDGQLAVIGITSSTTIVTTEMETDTVTVFLTVAFTAPVTSTLDTSTTTTEKVTTTAETTETTSTTYTYTAPDPHYTGIFRARGSKWDGQYAYFGQNVLLGFTAQRSEAVTIVRTASGRLAVKNMSRFLYTNYLPSLSPVANADESFLLSSGYPFLESTAVGPEGGGGGDGGGVLLSFRRGGQVAVPEDCVDNGFPRFADQPPNPGEECTEFSIVFEAL